MIVFHHSILFFSLKSRICQQLCAQIFSIFPFFVLEQWWTQWMFLLFFGKCKWTWSCLLCLFLNNSGGCRVQQECWTWILISSIRKSFGLLLVSQLVLLLFRIKVQQCPTLCNLLLLTILMVRDLLVFRCNHLHIPRALRLTTPRAWHRRIRLCLHQVKIVEEEDHLAETDGGTAVLPDLDQIVDLPGIIDVIIVSLVEVVLSELHLTLKVN